MDKIIKIGFLLDPSNSWLSKYLDDQIWLSKLPQNFSYQKFFQADIAINFDVLFILGYTKILTPDILNRNRLNLVIHESPLPKGRGFSPIQHQILEGKNMIPACLIEAMPNADEGDIFGTTMIHLEGHELLPEIRQAQAEATQYLILGFLSQYPRISRSPQNGVPTYYNRRKRVDDAIDINQTILNQFNKLRIINNEDYPAYFDLFGLRYKLTISKIDKND